MTRRLASRSDWPRMLDDELIRASKAAAVTVL